MTIVAPQTEASAVGHALTLRRPLRLEQVGERIYAVDGTPTDCVNIAIDEVLGGRADLVVSGINKGLNIGDDVTYSGTVAGALEGALLGYPAMAVSLEYTRATGTSRRPPRSPRARRGGARAAAAGPDVPQRERAARADKGMRATVQAGATTSRRWIMRIDPRQRPYFWIEEAQDDWEPHDGSDSAGDQRRLRLGDAAAAGSHAITSAAGPDAGARRRRWPLALRVR